MLVLLSFPRNTHGFKQWLIETFKGGRGRKKVKRNFTPISCRAVAGPSPLHHGAHRPSPAGTDGPCTAAAVTLNRRTALLNFTLLLSLRGGGGCSLVRVIGLRQRAYQGTG